MMKHRDFEDLVDLISLGSIEALEKLSSGVNFSKVRVGEYGLTLLHLAAWHNRPDVCEYLIHKGIDPDVSEKYSGKNPLHFASYLGHMESVFALCRNGAEALYSKKSVDALGCHPIHYAATSGNKKMIDFFLNIPKFDQISTKRSLCSVRRLSGLGNILDILIRKRNQTLLDYYSPIGGPHAVETNPNIFSAMYVGYNNENQWTPFHFAAVLGDIDALQILLKHFPNASSLDEDFKNQYCFLPGEVALAEGHVEAAKLLGYEGDIESYRQSMKVFSLRDGESKSMEVLANAVINRDEKSIDDFLNKNGVEAFSRQSFKTDIRKYYSEDNLNLYSIACRTFAFSFLNALIEKGVSIPDNEFSRFPIRDAVELPFFNWALMDINPLGEGFFKKVEHSIGPGLGP